LYSHTFYIIQATELAKNLNYLGDVGSCMLACLNSDREKESDAISPIQAALPSN